MPFAPLAAAQQGSVLDDLTRDLSATDAPVMVDSADPDLLFRDLPQGFKTNAATPAGLLCRPARPAGAPQGRLRLAAPLHPDHLRHRPPDRGGQPPVSGIRFPASDRGRDIGRTDIEASDKGVEIFSSVLGVIILALSLGFSYLYLVQVYPITDLF